MDFIPRVLGAAGERWPGLPIHPRRHPSGWSPTPPTRPGDLHSRDATSPWCWLRGHSQDHACSWVASSARTAQLMLAGPNSAHLAGLIPPRGSFWGISLLPLVSEPPAPLVHDPWSGSRCCRLSLCDHCRWVLFSPSPVSVSFPCRSRPGLFTPCPLQPQVHLIFQKAL